MTIATKGIVRGRTIELAAETGLPEGSEVTVSIEPPPMSREEWLRRLDALCGSWPADDPGVDEALQDLEQSRKTPPREVNLDDSP